MDKEIELIDWFCGVVCAVLALIALAFLAPHALAQSAVTTYPLAVTTTNASGSIALTNAFQSVQAATSTRKGCTIQNTGVNTMWVYFGAIAGATKAQSFPLFPADAAGQPGGYVTCSVGGVVLTDQVSITGTTADTFVATFQ
jgi:hypothetical protein